MSKIVTGLIVAAALALAAIPAFASDDMEKKEDAARATAEAGEMAKEADEMKALADMRKAHEADEMKAEAGETHM